MLCECLTCFVLHSEDAPRAAGDLAAEVRPDFAALRTDAYAGVPLIYLDSGVGSLGRS